MQKQKQTKRKTYLTKKRIKEREIKKIQYSIIVSLLIVSSIAILTRSADINYASADYEVIKHEVTEINEVSVKIEEKTLETNIYNVKEQIRLIADEKGFKWPDYLIRLARCENDNFDPKRTNVLGNTPAHSVDRGIFMINDYWHAEVSDECAFDVRCATEWTMERINDGYQSEWMCDAKAKRK